MMTMTAAIVHMKQQPDKPWAEVAPWYAAHGCGSLFACRRNLKRVGKPVATTHEFASNFGIVDFDGPSAQML